MLLRFGNLRGRGNRIHFGGCRVKADGQAEVVLKLLDVSAFLAALDAFGAAVVHQPHVLCPLNHTVEVVGPYGVLIFVGGQAEAFPKLRRNKGGLVALAREGALVGAKDYQVAEVQGAGLQRPHNLQALQGFSPERYRLPLQQAVQHPQVRGGKQIKVYVDQHG